MLRPSVNFFPWIAHVVNGLAMTAVEVDKYFSWV